MFKQLQAAFQYYADKGQLMTVRRANTEDISILDSNGNPLATLRTEPMKYIKDMWETKELDDNYVSTSLVCDHIPLIEQFEMAWTQYKGMRNIIVPDIKLYKSLVRDLSNEATPLRPEEILPYMRKEDGWTDEMIDAFIKEMSSEDIPQCEWTDADVDASTQKLLDDEFFPNHLPPVKPVMPVTLGYLNHPNHSTFNM